MDDAPPDGYEQYMVDPAETGFEELHEVIVAMEDKTLLINLVQGKGINPESLTHREMFVYALLLEMCERWAKIVNGDGEFVSNAFTRMSRLERLLSAQALLDDERQRDNPVDATACLDLAWGNTAGAIQRGAGRGPK